jgi:hypothetical protein
VSKSALTVQILVFLAAAGLLIGPASLAATLLLTATARMALVLLPRLAALVALIALILSFVDVLL